MELTDIPFGITDWSTLEATEHRGESGVALWRTREFGGVRVRLVGTRSDTWGVGATASLSGSGGAVPQVRQVNVAHGTSSQSEPILHFGVGRAAGPHEVRVEWPSGAVSQVTLPADGKVHRVVEPAFGVGVIPTRPVFGGSTSPYYPDWMREGGR